MCSLNIYILDLHMSPYGDAFVYACVSDVSGVSGVFDISGVSGEAGVPCVSGISGVSGEAGEAGLLGLSGIWRHPAPSSPDPGQLPRIGCSETVDPNSWGLQAFDRPNVNPLYNKLLGFAGVRPRRPTETKKSKSWLPNLAKYREWLLRASYPELAARS